MKKTYKIEDVVFDKSCPGYRDDVMDYGQETCDKVLSEFFSNLTVDVDPTPADTLEQRIDDAVREKVLYPVISYTYREV